LYKNPKNFLHRVQILFMSLIIFLSFFSIQSFAQTEEELKKMMEQLKSLGDSLENYEEEMDSESQKHGEAFKKLFEDVQKEQNKTVNKEKKDSNSDYSIVDFSLPKKKTDVLKKLPTSAPSKEKIINYLKTLITELESNKEFSKDVAHAKQEIVKLKDPASYNNAAQLFWYNKSPITAIAISLILAEKSNYNTLHLNNLSALLNLTGNPERAIPILLYIDNIEPSSIMVNNNLGQAYFQLGDIETATNYLKIVVQKEENHIQANLTLGIISLKTNKNKEAEKYLTNSLRGGYTEDAYNFLSELLPDANIEELVYGDENIFEGMEIGFIPSDYSDYAMSNKGPSINTSVFGFPSIISSSEDFPSGFINFDNRCVQFPSSPEDIGRFNGEITAMQDAWREWMDVWSVGFESKMQNTITQLMNNRQPEMNGPFIKKAVFMLKVYGKQFDKRLKEAQILFTDKLTNAIEVQKNTMIEVDNRCRPIEDADERRECYCSGENEALAALLGTMRGPYTTYCDYVSVLAMKYYNAISYWSSIAYDSNPMVKNTLLQQTQAGYYAAMVSRFNLELPLPCDVNNLDKTENINLAFSDSDCPINISIPFVIGELSLNCKSFSILGGEGMKFGYERDFSSKTSTVLFGPGAGVQSGAVNFEANALGFVTWNNDNSISDYGVRATSGVSAGGVGPFTAGGMEAQVQVGVESGFSYSSSIKAFNQSVISYQF
jgi:tetratricopeptide (TPR) repeat protein